MNSMASSMQMSEYGLKGLFDNQEYSNYASNNSGANEDAVMNDVEQQKPEPVVQQQKVEQDSWLITPLPSLVSLQTSQKSLIENAPLENLLIEHPSMSVFITQDEINEAEEAAKDT